MSDRDFSACVLPKIEVGENLAKAYRRTLGEMFDLPGAVLYPDDRLDDFMLLGKRDWDFMEIIFSLEDTLQISVDLDYDFNFKKSIGEWLQDLYSLTRTDIKDVKIAASDW